jgi:hypothetical protein
MNALRGTGAEPLEELLLLDPLPPEPLVEDGRELVPDELALCEAADPPADPERTLAPPVPLDDRAEVVLVLVRPELLPVDRFSTDGTAFNDEPLLLELGVSSEFPADAALPEPAPEDEPAVFEATVVVEPVWEDCM